MSGYTVEHVVDRIAYLKESECPYCQVWPSIPCALHRRRGEVPADLTKKEIGEQAVKALRYFERAFDEHDGSWLALEDNGVVLVIARGNAGELLREAINGGALLGKPGPGVEQARRLE